MRRVFIIGPAGVGKSTCGRLLADRLSYNFVDQDAEFNKCVAEVESYIRQAGYSAYCYANSALFHELIHKQQGDAVYALSSGFLMYQDVDGCFSRNADAMAELGVSILLLPSRSIEKTEEIVVKRVLARRVSAVEEKERRKIRERYPRYLGYGDIKIFSAEEPAIIVRKMELAYYALLEERIRRIT